MFALVWFVFSFSKSMAAVCSTGHTLLDDAQSRSKRTYLLRRAVSVCTVSCVCEMQGRPTVSLT